MTPSQKETRDVEIGKHSRITLGVAWAILGVALSTAIGGVMMYDDLKNQVKNLQSAQFTKDDQMRWAMELKTQNPDISVPVPYWNEQQHANISNRVMAATLMTR